MMIQTLYFAIVLQSSQRASPSGHIRHSNRDIPEERTGSPLVRVAYLQRTRLARVRSSCSVLYDAYHHFPSALRRWNDAFCRGNEEYASWRLRTSGGLVPGGRHHALQKGEPEHSTLCLRPSHLRRSVPSVQRLEAPFPLTLGRQASKESHHL